MTAEKPTIVIAPGAWQLRTAWSRFISILEEAGYPTEYVDPPTLGGTTLPLAGLADDIAAARKTLGRLLDEGKYVRILCHSAGGVVASNAVEGLDTASRKAQGLQGGVAQIIYLTAFMLPAGKSLFDMLGGKPLPWMEMMDDRVLVNNTDASAEIGLNDLDADARKIWSKEMTHSALGLFTTASNFEPWANSIPIAYIFCTEDNAITYPIQQQMALQAGPDLAFANLHAGHCPYISVPYDLLEAVETILVLAD
ncbi:Alpha/beta hydrolase fold-1 [Dactylonectria macrodidyma]|uniref:Alpha/beta hydrolase fold-1 n=1 Tax=Dactylonectria macrodidyma TaxID=307937 RepID=A0A9P9IQA4_9HYPO|nr:Alpha/beta hydrolase fold-1 [Dactylonectria macrodidyma]